MDSRIIGTGELCQAVKCIDDAVVLFNDLEKQIVKSTEKIETLKEKLEAAVKARVIIQTVAKQVQQTIETRINKIVNLALQIVFQEESPVFMLKMVQRRNQLEADIMVDDMDDILDSNAGGVSNIVAFAMRFVMWSFSPRKRNVLILDEPFKDLSKEYQHNVAEMVSVLAKKTNAQIIMVSHHVIPTDFIDNSIKVKK